MWQSHLAKMASGLPPVAMSLPGFQLESVQGILAPARIPPLIVNRLNQEIVALLKGPDTKQRFLDFGLEPVDCSPGEFAARIRSDLTRLAKVIKDAGIKVE